MRGTSSDSLADSDWPSNFIDLGGGIPTDIAIEISGIVEQIQNDTGQKVVVVGHSRGGAIAEQVARLNPDSIEYIVNVQGPSVVEVTFVPGVGILPTPLGVKTLINISNGAPQVEVFRITASEYDPTTLGLAQFALDNIGVGILPPTDIPIDVGIHSAIAAAQHFGGKRPVMAL